MSHNMFYFKIKLFLSLFMALSILFFCKPVALAKTGKSQQAPSRTSKSKPKGDVIILDKIIAKIGSQIVLKSDLDKAYIQYVVQFGEPKDKNIKRELLKNIIISKLFLNEGNIDIEVNEKMVGVMVESRIQQMLKRVGGSEENLKAATQMSSMSKIKELLRKNMTEQYIISEIQNDISKNVFVSIDDIKNYIKKYDKDLPVYERSVIFKRFVKYPSVTESERKQIIKKLNDIKSQLKKGASFISLAAQYSDDESTADKGGEVGFFWKKGTLLKEYEEASILLETNQISDAVETEKGFYIIQLMRKQGNEYYTRHIVLKSKNKDEQIKQTKEYLEKVKKDILEGKTTIDKQINESKSKDKRGFLASGYIKSQNQEIRINLKNKPSYIDNKFFDLPVGSIIGPQLVKNKKDSFVQLILIEKKIPKHKANMQYDYQAIKEVVREEKRMHAIKKWVENAIANNKESIKILDPKYADLELTIPDN